MTHKVDMVMDFQYGSTGKGLIAGYLAKRENYDTAICSFATNAGHTYIDESRMMHAMTQQLPTAAVSSTTVKNVLLGPGSLIHIDTLMAELKRYSKYLAGKRIMIHPQAAIVTDKHMAIEKEYGTKIGSTVKGVGEAMIHRIRRDPLLNNTAGGVQYCNWLSELGLLVTADEYTRAVNQSENVIIEGAQGYSLSLYHGQYPYVTSRDVTPWQIAADCGIPFKWASYIQVIGTIRTYPIRVNNRDGSSGPCYPDQREIQWSDIGIKPELTTVTKLPRRIFTFSRKQLTDAMFHCSGYWNTRLFLNFANYMNREEIMNLAKNIELPVDMALNPPSIHWFGYGPDDKDVTRTIQ